MEPVVRKTLQVDRPTPWDALERARIEAALRAWYPMGQFPMLTAPGPFLANVGPSNIVFYYPEGAQFDEFSRPSRALSEIPEIGPITFTVMRQEILYHARARGIMRDNLPDGPRFDQFFGAGWREIGTVGDYLIDLNVENEFSMGQMFLLNVKASVLSPLPWRSAYDKVRQAVAVVESFGERRLVAVLSSLNKDGVE